MQRAYYESSLQDFLQQDENLILGILARNNEYTLEDLQRNAWLAEIKNSEKSISSFENRPYNF